MVDPRRPVAEPTTAEREEVLYGRLPHHIICISILVSGIRLNSAAFDSVCEDKMCCLV